MNESDTPFSNLDTPFILDNEVLEISNIKNEILKIKDLINIKYLTIKNTEQKEVKNYPSNNFISIRNTTNKINDYINKKTLSINDTIEKQENELKLLYQEKKLLDQNKIQSDIIYNQQILIKDFKKTKSDLSFNLDKTKKRLEENIYSNRTLEINNNELKSTISRYIINNKKLQLTINHLKLENSEPLLNKEQVNEINDKVKFYQAENIRLSSELITLQSDYEIIKNNFANAELKKNDVYKKIQELNNSLIKNKLVSAGFVKNIDKDDSINHTKLNHINNDDLSELKKTAKEINVLDNDIDNIFN